MNSDTFTRFLVISLVVIAFSVSVTYGQKYANHWPFSNYELNFSNSQVSVTRTYAPHLNRGMGVISDNAGNLLMYTDGYSLFTKNHTLMPNGGNLIPATTSNSLQESMIIPKPGDDNIFYVFTVDPAGTTSGLYYSEVNMTLNNGLGDVMTKGIQLIPNTSNKLSAILHENGEDVWLIAQNNGSVFFVLLITDQGISDSILQQGIAPVDGFRSGQLKFSPDGKKVAMSYSGISNGGAKVFEFDNATGALSHAMDFSFRDIDSSPSMEGLEFSSDGTKLYAYESRSNYVFQFDLSSGDFETIKSSRNRVSTPNIYNNYRQLQLAPDGKIYITKGGGGGGSQHLAVIDNPNAPWSKVVIREKGLYLEGGSSFVNFTPNFIQDYFYEPSFNYTGHCQAAPVQFDLSNNYHVDSLRWHFGEGSTSTLRSTKFKYTIAGTYDVTLLTYYQGIADTIRQSVVIDPYTPFELGADVSLCRESVFAVNDDFSSYLWSTGDTTNYIRIKDAGLYKLTAINSFGCAYRDSVMVSVNELPVIALPDSIRIGSGTSASLVPGDFASYSWSTGEISASISVSNDGWYSVAVVDASGCSSVKSVYVYHNLPTPEPDAKWILLNPLPSVSAGRDIFFLDERTGFVVNGNDMLRTNDQGESWNIQMRMPNGRRISFKNSIGYVVGSGGTVYKSTHRGDGWNKVSFPSTDLLNAVSIIHPDTVFITSDSKLFVTNNGGKSWNTISVAGVNIEDSFFTSAKVGHLACQNGRILKTTDGGATWRTILTSNSIPTNFFRITFVNELVGFASREHSDLFKTTDGGETWATTGYTPDAAYGIHFLNENVGFIAGTHGAISKTNNGGLTWTWAGFDGRKSGNDLFSIFFINENQGFATGLGGRIIKSKDGGATWSQFATTHKAIRQVEFTSEDIGYFQTGNEFFKTTNSGIGWAKINSSFKDFSSSPVFDFINDLVGYALVGRSVYKTTNGGADWEKTHASNISHEDLGAIHFLDESVGFVSGGYNFRTVLRTEDGGKSWTHVLGNSFGQIQFLSANVGYARNVGNLYNRIYKTLDGGLTWNVMFEIDDDIKAFHFLTESMGFFVGDDGMMYKNTDGGLQWEKITVPYAYYVDVTFTSERFGYILDDYGKLYNTTNGGATWSLEPIGNSLSIHLFNRDVYAIGNYGAIFKHSLGFKELVKLNSLSLQNLTESSVTFSSYLTSNIELVSAIVVVEIRKEDEEYENPLAVKTVSGYVSESVTYEFQDLEPGTTYVIRYRLIEGASEITTPEITFTTPPVITAIDESIIRTSFTIYPNPAKDHLQIDARVSDFPFDYEIRDMVGHLVVAGKSVGTTSVNVQGFHQGIYVLTIKGKEIVFGFKIMKE